MRQEKQTEAQERQRLAAVEREKKRALAEEHKRHPEAERARKRQHRQQAQAGKRAEKVELKGSAQRRRELVLSLARAVSGGGEFGAGVCANPGPNGGKTGRGGKRRPLRTCQFVAGIVVGALSQAMDT